MIGIDELQKAIFDRLTKGSTKISLPVYDGMPPDQIPYVLISAVTESDRSGKACPLSNAAIDLIIYSIQEGKSYVYSIAKEIKNSLTFTNDKTYNPVTMPNTELSYSAMGLVVTKIDYTDIFKWQGTISCVFKLKEK